MDVHSICQGSPQECGWNFEFKEISEMRWTFHYSGVSQNVAEIFGFKGNSEMKWTVHFSGCSQNVVGIWDSREFGNEMERPYFRGLPECCWNLGFKGVLK